jgi:polysaccharide biosynthesis protein PslG
MTIQTHKRTSLKLRILLTLGVLLAGVFSYYIVRNNFLSKSSRENVVVSYHGPNPQTVLAALGPEDILGKSTKRPKPTTQTTTTTPAKGTTSVTTKEFGIAAGGGLAYLGQTDLNKYFSAMKTLGAKWVRWDIDWGQVQPNNSAGFDWSSIDRVVNTAISYGIESVCDITYTPKWAAASECTSDFACAPANPQAFGVFSGQVASRYKGKVTYFEVWNEPNYSVFWQPRPNASKYGQILKEAYTQIKSANPQAFVLSGGLAASGDEVDGSLSPLTFLKTIYSEGNNKFFDAVALHPYTFPAGIDYAANWNSWQQMPQVHKLMTDRGDVDKKIWITEFGAPTSGPGKAHEINDMDNFTYGVDFMSESAQNELVKEASSFYNTNTSWMGPFFWFSFHDIGTSKNNSENFYGLLKYDWSQKPAYATFKAAILGR